MSAQEPRYGPQTREDEQANDQVYRDALKLIAASYAIEQAEPAWTYQLKREQDRAASLAQALVQRDRKAGRP